MKKHTTKIVSLSVPEIRVILNALKYYREENESSKHEIELLENDLKQFVNK